MLGGGFIPGWSFYLDLDLDTVLNDSGSVGRAGRSTWVGCLWLHMCRSFHSKTVEGQGVFDRAPVERGWPEHIVFDTTDVRKHSCVVATLANVLALFRQKLFPLNTLAIQGKVYILAMNIQPGALILDP